MEIIGDYRRIAYVFVLNKGFLDLSYVKFRERLFSIAGVNIKYSRFRRELYRYNTLKLDKIDYYILGMDDTLIKSVCDCLSKVSLGHGLYLSSVEKGEVLCKITFG